MAFDERLGQFLTIRWRRELRSLFSLLLFAGCAWLILQSWELALIVTVALGIHELGHVLAIARFQIPWEMGFGLVGAWTVTPLKARQALDHFSNSLIHLAGPLFNLLYALLALAFHRAYAPPPIPDYDYWLRIANFNALLALLNTLPLSNVTDGGKFVKRLFASLDEKSEVRVFWTLSLWFFLLAWIGLVTHHSAIRILSIVVIGVWFIGHLLFESAQDNPAETSPAKAMTRWQAGILISGLVVLLLCSIALVMLTPFWFTRAHALNMVDGLIWAIIYAVFHAPQLLLYLCVLAGGLVVYKYGVPVRR